MALGGKIEKGKSLGAQNGYNNPLYY